jgi:hypothetical protein
MSYAGLPDKLETSFFLFIFLKLYVSIYQKIDYLFVALNYHKCQGVLRFIDLGTRNLAFDNTAENACRSHGRK